MGHYHYHETKLLYHIISDYFSVYPSFHWICVGIVTALLLGLLFVDQSLLRRFPTYGYMSVLLLLIALLDILTQIIPLLTVYLIVLGYVQFRTRDENPHIVTASYAVTYLIINVLTCWHQLMVLELVSQSLLFVWMGWLSDQVRRSYFEVRKFKEKNCHLVDKIQEAQKRLHEYNDEIEEYYRRDTLTGLYNFGAFQEQVTRSLARCGMNQSYHVICLDLTDFLQVNMQKGIDAGNQILIQIARQLKKNLPPSAKVARYDGDQFAVGVMGDYAVFRRCLEIIEKVMADLKEERKLVSYCLGTASYPREVSCGAELIRLAEQRLMIEQRRLRHQQEERRRHLEKLSAVGQLAAGLAHEIRNPLTSIRGFVQISASESEAVKKWESIILPEIDRINDLLKQFLNLSETRPARFTRFNLDQLMNDVLSLLQPKSFLMGHELIAHPPPSPVDIEADAEQIKQVLINLIQNGLESLEEKGKVEVRWKEFRDRVNIRVQDNGSGIKPEHLTRIFDPFFTTKGEGTGMGLSVCHRIITEHGGQIYAVSQPGRGTTFNIHLPVCQSLKELPVSEKKVPQLHADSPEKPPKSTVSLHPD
ncbi:ATP-binding protein [Paenactinomyces guangxiensis]|uniref:histidine kinase n=1 Tax=Paenactinomyces guangxiensis TaxID=1490290 RepID=A0A7W2A726_9BACL|nr:ATP-binding protein [Paenactinomyces guangxiensis]MBA4494071.1 diguanylate cyclase [Paenactinomyces guangxiensis]MBH8591184.1 diguanylate cyclase [Paenactinomyces guangxiensis]